MKIIFSFILDSEGTQFSLHYLMLVKRSVFVNPLILCKSLCKLSRLPHLRFFVCLSISEAYFALSYTEALVHGDSFKTNY